jgi:hypothetical protein
MGEREEMFQRQLQTFKLVSDDIRKASGPVKCENVALKNTKLFHIKFLYLISTEKYNRLKSEGIQYRQLEDSLKQEYTGRISMILISELNVKNKITTM